MASLDPGDGRCGIVVDEGLLFRTNEDAFIKTKRKLLDEFDLWCILSLPGGVFTQAGAGVKTNLLFFRSGRPTERIWYYDLSDIKVSKTRPLTREIFEHRLVPRTDAEGVDDQGAAGEADWGFLALLPRRADSPFSWTIDLPARRAQLKAEAQPLRDQALTKRREAAPFGERLQQLKTPARKDQDENDGSLAFNVSDIFGLPPLARGGGILCERRVRSTIAVSPSVDNLCRSCHGLDRTVAWRWRSRTDQGGLARLSRDNQTNV